MAVTHTIVCLNISIYLYTEKFSKYYWRKGLEHCHNPQHEAYGKINLNTNEVRRVWLLLPQNNYVNRLEDLKKDIVASKIILLTCVLSFGLPYNKKWQRSLDVMLAMSYPTSDIWPRRVWRKILNCGQCRRWCSGYQKRVQERAKDKMNCLISYAKQLECANKEETIGY